MQRSTQPAGIGSASLARSSDEAVRVVLRRITASEAFRDSPQSIQFLHFVVEETLQGRGSELKGYTIATRALGRPENFDPQTDPIVRVQAGRVRKALAEYDAEAGGADPLRIVLDRGSYVPRFEATETTSVAAEPVGADVPGTALEVPATAAGIPVRRSAARWFALAGVILLLAATGLWQFWPGRVAPEAVERPAPMRARLTALPIIEVVPEPASQPADDSVRHRLGVMAGMLRDALSRFDDLVLVRDGSAATGTQVNYRVILQPADNSSNGGLIVRLVALPDGTAIWRHGFPAQPGEDDGPAWKLAVVRSVATSLAQPYGIIPADARARFAFEGSAGVAYRCLLAGFDYWRRADAESHLTVRNCLLENARQERPLSATLAQLTYSYLEEFRHGFNPMTGDPRERARAAAERAVALAPGSARAHQALLASHFAVRRFDEAFAAGLKALELNPFDAEILADVGARYVQVDDIARGLPMIEKAIVQMPAPPIWARVYLALGYYADGRRDEAARVTVQISGDASPLALMARILAAYHLRDEASLRDLLRQLKENHPSIERDPGAYFDRLVISPSLTRRLLDSLALAQTQFAR